MPSSPPGRLLRWIVPPVFALGFLVAIAVLNRGEDWAVTGRSGDGFLADSARVPAGLDPAGLARLLRAARHLSTDGSTQVRLSLDYLLTLEIDPSTRIASLRTPGRFVDTDLDLALAEGSLRVLKGPSFNGRKLRAYTPEARLEIDGTLIGLHRTRDSTRVDVYEGEVRIGSVAPGPPLVVQAGQSAVVKGAAAPVLTGPVDPAEMRRLATFRSGGRAPRGPAGTAGGTSGG